MLWLHQTSPGTIELLGRVRPSGSATWRKIQVTEHDAIQDLAVAPTKNGDFWLTWVRYAPSNSVPQVYAMRLVTGKQSWTRRTKLFNGPSYGHQSPRIEVSGDGTLFVAATASPKESTNPPTYRARVGVKPPGKSWRTTFLSPVDEHAGVRDLDVSPQGHALVTFVQGYELAQMHPQAAVRPPGASSTWEVDALSTPGDAQSAHGSIGPDGTAAVAWNAPSTGSSTVRLATRKIGAAGEWVVTDAVTGPGTHIAQPPVVGLFGSTTAFWWDGRIHAREFAEGVWTAPQAVSPPGVRSDVRDAELRADGLVVLLYQQFDASLDNLGLRWRLIDHGLPFEELVLTTTADHEANQPRLGVDAAGHSNVTWTRGDFTLSDFASMGNPPSAPIAMDKPYFGAPLSTARATGSAAVGRWLTCASGYWVERSSLSHRWFRGSDPVRGATGKRYRLVPADLGRKVSCRVTAVSATGETTLTSHQRLVG